jgi:antitoxin (DNA-binding transcriptional repressor) of toxin-antitoxin stability system
MKFISSRDLRSNPGNLWEILKTGEAVITVNGKPKALVLAAENDIEELIQTIRSYRAQNALESLRASSLAQGKDKLSEVEIGKEIQSARKKK